MASPGFVYLVGAGPGDPDLLTLRGAACLRRADIVLYDYLVNPLVLRHARAAAERIALGQHGRGRSLSPDEIATRMVVEARRGRVVVRLKGGDPSVFGRLDDELEALRRADILFEVVPGITAGLAAAAYCEIPLTQHDDASAVAFVAGRERCGKSESGLDFAALACFPGTLVFYMGIGTAGDWSQALMRHGKPGSTPVAVVGWCTRARQRVARCTLETIVETVHREGVRPPAICIVGPVVSHAPAQSWFTKRPLFGLRVLVLGGRAPATCLRRELAALGAELVLPPAAAPADSELLRELEQGEVECVVCTGAGSARGFVRRYGDALARTRMVAVGTGPAAVLRRARVPFTAVPAADTDALVDSLLSAEQALVCTGS